MARGHTCSVYFMKHYETLPFSSNINWKYEELSDQRNGLASSLWDGLMTANDVEMSRTVVCCCALRQTASYWKGGCPDGKPFHSHLWSAGCSQWYLLMAWGEITLTESQKQPRLWTYKALAYKVIDLSYCASGYYESRLEWDNATPVSTTQDKFVRLWPRITKFVLSSIYKEFRCKPLNVTSIKNDMLSAHI